MLLIDNDTGVIVGHVQDLLATARQAQQKPTLQLTGQVAPLAAMAPLVCVYVCVCLHHRI